MGNGIRSPVGDLARGFWELGGESVIFLIAWLGARQSTTELDARKGLRTANFEEQNAGHGQSWARVTKRRVTSSGKERHPCRLSATSAATPKQSTNTSS